MIWTKYDLLRRMTHEYGDMQKDMISYYAHLPELEFVLILKSRFINVEPIGSKRYVIK